MFRCSVVLSLVFVVTACASTSLESRREKANDIAKVGGLNYQTIKTSEFTLASYYRFGESSEVTIYIEGDGFPYVTPNSLSRNPTPLRPIGLLLASVDRGSSVIYLARPCHYIDISREFLCTDKYWSTHRFAEEVIYAYQEALDSIKSMAGADTLNLVGYSGGGAVAVLTAAGRGDIGSIRTIAAYLDHIELNRAVGAAPLKGSLDPLTVAPWLKGIAQIHYAGANDSVIPPWVIENFVMGVNDPRCVRFIILDGVGHELGWMENWVKLSKVRPIC